MKKQGLIHHLTRQSSQVYLRLIWGLSPAYLAVNSDKAPREMPQRGLGYHAEISETEDYYLDFSLIFNRF